MSSSSDLETGITQHIVQKKTKKTKKKSKPAAVVPADDPKNEGDDPHWAYEPPEGAVLLDHGVDVGAFEWDAIKDDDDVDIWLIRAPDSVRSRHAPYPRLTFTNARSKRNTFKDSRSTPPLLHHHEPPASGV